MKIAMRFAVLALAVGVFTPAAQSATINVFSGEVAVNAGNGRCSLREAIANAESNSDTSGGDCTAGSGSDTIVLANGTYVLPDAAISDPNYGDSGLPAANSTFTINGNGSTIERNPSLFTGTACNGGTNFRIFYVGPTGNLTLNNLALQNGCADFGGTGAGGALFNRGTLSLYQAIVTNNEAKFSAGAIQNDGTMNLTQSMVSGNDNAVSGGGIVNRGTMNVIQSTINGNSTSGAGGGVDTGDSATATFANSTISGNQSNGTGGAIYNQSNTAITNATIALNDGSNSAGSGVYSDGGTVTLTNSIVAEQANGPNCYNLSGGGNNLDDDGTCPTAINAAPLIGPLANNGGPTLTQALLAGSPAFNTGNSSVCNASPVNGVDQRGISRPNTTCDIGAVEGFAATFNRLVPTLDHRSLVALMLLFILAGGMLIRSRKISAD